MKTYRVIFVPSYTSYEYLVEANDTAEAEIMGWEFLQEAIGWDASRDWSCSAIKEEV